LRLSIQLLLSRLAFVLQRSGQALYAYVSLRFY
jgi:hypothetical protein